MVSVLQIKKLKPDDMVQGKFCAVLSRNTGTRHLWHISNRNTAPHLTMSLVNRNGKVVSAKKSIAPYFSRRFDTYEMPHTSFQRFQTLQSSLFIIYECRGCTNTLCVLNLHSQKWKFQANALVLDCSCSC